jgi:hypothetical protein
MLIFVVLIVIVIVILIVLASDKRSVSSPRFRDKI